MKPLVFYLSAGCVFLVARMFMFWNKHVRLAAHRLAWGPTPIWSALSFYRQVPQWLLFGAVVFWPIPLTIILCQLLTGNDPDPAVLPDGTPIFPMSMKIACREHGEHPWALDYQCASCCRKYVNVGTGVRGVWEDVPESGICQCGVRLFPWKTTQSDQERGHFSVATTALHPGYYSARPFCHVCAIALERSPTKDNIPELVSRKEAS